MTSDLIVYGGRRIAIVLIPALMEIKIVPLCSRGHSGSLSYSDLALDHENVRLVQTKVNCAGGQIIKTFDLAAGATRIGRLIASVTKDGIVCLYALVQCRHSWRVRGHIE